jgi:hypothetical protein
MSSQRNRTVDQIWFFGVGQSGAVLAVKTDADAESFTYLEACMRAMIDGSDKPLFLSSGGEVCCCMPVLC